MSYLSYDIWLEIDAGGLGPISYGFWNYNASCAAMWRVAGADLAGFDRRPARLCIPTLQAAVALMQADVPIKSRTL